MKTVNHESQHNHKCQIICKQATTYKFYLYKENFTHWPLEDVAVILKLIQQNSSFNTHCEVDLRWMLQNLTDEKSTLIQVIAWCRQATSHYLS